MKRLVLLALAHGILCTSCMTDKEYALRYADIEAKKAHPATFEVATITTDPNFKLEGKAVITIAAPTQPYSHTPIPDGVAKNASIAKAAMLTGAAITSAALIAGGNGDTTNTTTTTTTTSNGGAE